MAISAFLNRLALAGAISGLAFIAWKIVGAMILARAGMKRAALPEGFVPGKPGVLVFSSTACVACVRLQEPALRRLEREAAGSVQILEIDVLEHPELARRYGILSLPTVILLDASGSPRRVRHGVVPYAELLAHAVNPIRVRSRFSPLRQACTRS